MRPEFVRPRQLALIATHQCTAACDHCCFACTPQITKRIPAGRLASLIDEAREIPSIVSVGFTGGECFLLGRELDDLTARASSHGFHVTCNTNGYWAVNRKAAVQRMERLAGLGLKTVSLSTGEMHARFVPPERIVHGAVAAYDAGLEVSVSIEEFEGTTFDWRTIVEDPEIARRRGPRMTVFMRTWMENADGIGSTALRHNQRGGRFRKDQMSGCGTMLDTLAITPDLKLVSCCGYPLESIPDLHLGSVADRTIKQVLDAAADDVLKLWIHVAGPERMLLFVKKYLPAYRLPRKCVDICQTCVHMHADPEVMRILREHAGEVEEEISWMYQQCRDAMGARPAQLPQSEPARFAASGAGS